MYLQSFYCVSVGVKYSIIKNASEFIIIIIIIIIIINNIIHCCEENKIITWNDTFYPSIHLSRKGRREVSG